MRVLITGGTGLVGRSLARSLLDRGDTPVVVTRDAGSARRHPELAGAEIVEGDPTRSGDWQRSVDGADAVVNLAGQPVLGPRWTDAYRRAIRDSRVLGTRNVVDAIERAETRPGVLVSASAIGYYGPRGDEELDESAPAGQGFLPDVCRQWEAEAVRAVSHGVRVVLGRIGIVLDPKDGALAQMVPIFRNVPGGAAPIGGGLVGRGQQWMSWIHRDDVVGMLRFALDTPALAGPMNVTAPTPARNADFSRLLAKVLHRPFLPVGPPDIVLRAILGAAADIVTKGQRVVPRRALESGYTFRYPDLARALQDVLG